MEARMERYYPFRKIEKKWQDYWRKKGQFKVKEDPKRKKYYLLEMFPYPSGKLHMGHMRNYVVGDTLARFLRMKGHNVLYPMGYDSFGLPAENAAFQNKTHPAEWTRKCISDMRRQQEKMGLSYDWDRLVITCQPDYYKWNQWIFLKFYERGLAYKKKAPINWCPKCRTVLANEQVEGGKCWRCESKVEIRDLEQWFFKITEYAEELLKDLEELKGWPERVKLMQKNWIGKSTGTLVNFRLKDSDKILPIFTTRPDTRKTGYHAPALKTPRPRSAKRGRQNSRQRRGSPRAAKLKTQRGLCQIGNHDRFCSIHRPEFRRGQGKDYCLPGRKGMGEEDGPI